MSENISAFNLLHPLVQQELYRMKWSQLRFIQVESIRKINNNNKNIVISANTASGKTEAAFLPIISEILKKPDTGIKALYIGPLKALINDQFRRVEDLCNKTNISVHKWHGDVSASKKKQTRLSPEGILLITPESLESIFINHTSSLYKLFNNLEYIVIDEMHSFIGQERGIHLKNLILRLNRITEQDMRLIGLSATLGDMNKAGQWMTENMEKSFELINDSDQKKSISYLILGYEKKTIDLNNNEKDFDSYEEITNDLFSNFQNETSLIFGNNKSKLEYLADTVIKKATVLGYKNPFRVHHGSLSKFERESVEKELKSDQIISVFCSSTLEMGIDVGDISVIGQLEAPWSVNSLVQRLGRSGRKDDQISIMKLFVTENETDENSSILDKIYLNLIQSIALTELMIEKWIESPETDNLHFSTLVHQILSVIAQFGGITALNLYDQLITNGAFYKTKKQDFIQLLKSIAKHDLIEQTTEGTLILGLLGEKIVRRFDFYSVFKSPDEIKVIFKGKVIGTISNDPGIIIDTYLILSGKRWKIIEINKEKKEILVTTAKGKKIPKFESTSIPKVDKKIRKKMNEILTEDKEYIYLNEKAKEMLQFARNNFLSIEEAERIFFKEGNNIVWFTWTGTSINLTLFILTKNYLGLEVEMNDVALIFSDISIEDLKEKLCLLLDECPDELELAKSFPLKSFEKYDDFLTDELQSIVFAKNYLDLDGALTLIKRILKANK